MEITESQPSLDITHSLDNQRSLRKVTCSKKI